MDGTDDFFTGGPVEQQGGVGVGVGVPVDGAASAEGGGAPEVCGPISGLSVFGQCG